MRNHLFFMKRALVVAGSLWALSVGGGAAWAGQPPEDADVESLPILKNGYTDTGLSVGDIKDLLYRGYRMDDILRAEAIGAHYGLNVPDLLARHTAEGSWEDVTKKIARSQSTPQPAKDVSDADLLVLVKQEGGLTDQAIEQLRNQGYNPSDILHAQRYAKEYGLPVEQVLYMKGRADWNTLAQNLSVMLNFSLEPQVVDDTGLSEQEISALLQQGHELGEILQAASIARASSRTLQEVLSLSKGRNWREVAQELVPGGRFPDQAEAPSPESRSVEGRASCPAGAGESAPLVFSPSGSTSVPEDKYEGQEHNGWWHYHPGWWELVSYWYPHYHPGYSYSYYYFDFWCWCWRIRWVYIPGYIHWHLMQYWVYHPGYYHWHSGSPHPPPPPPPSTSYGYYPANPTGSNGWYSTPMTVTLSATGDGITQTQYMWESDSAWAPSSAETPGATTTWSTYTGPVQVPGDGIWRLKYRSIDKHGNYEPVKQTPTPLRMDRAAPAISNTRTVANSHGWNNTNVTVSFSCSDSVSGVASCTSPMTLSLEGANQSVTGQSKDMAGNSSSKVVSGINIDKTVPTLTAARTAANAHGWNNADVTVSFTCSDVLSGVLSCMEPVTVSSEGSNQSVIGSASDRAGNASSKVVSGINIDKTVPTLTAARTAANAYGWNNADVTVSFTCSDALSGVLSCMEPVTVSSEGSNQSVTGSASDRAGNASSKVVSGINIDKTAPIVDLHGGREYTVDKMVLITCTASDSLSGVASSPCDDPLVQTDAYNYDPGTYPATASANDKAGNIGSGSTNYTIVVTPDSLGNLVERFVPTTTPGRHGRVNSLQSKLQAVEASAARGNMQAKQNGIEAFVNEVEAQTGKSLPADKAAVLTRLVRFL